ncbi:hypothetical protein EJB05_17446, partial [Eragrostis curvula]
MAIGKRLDTRIQPSECESTVELYKLLLILKSCSNLAVLELCLQFVHSNCTTCAAVCTTAQAAPPLGTISISFLGRHSYV